jgi:hypothetical protein
MRKKPGALQRAFPIAIGTICLTLSLTIALGAKRTKSKAPGPSPTPAATPSKATAPDATPASADPNPAETPKPQFDPSLWSGMQWREVGPFRGGRAVAIEGVPSEPNTY